MAGNGIDLSQLDKFTESMIRSSKSASKEYKKFLRKEGNKLKRKVKAQVRVKGIKTHTGNYLKRIKRGKVWSERDGTYQVRVYSNAPHAHLIELGHDKVVNPPKAHGRGVKPGRGIGRNVGHVKGREVFLEAYEAFEPQFHKDSEDAIDDIINKI